MSELIPARGQLKTARSKVQTDINGDGIILLKIPGNAGSYSRLIKGGVGWFDSHHADDNVCMAITDEDNILGGGAGVEVASYYDDEVPAANRGWYIPPSGSLEIHAITDIAELLAGLYLKITVKKGDNSQDWFRCNINWGTID